MQVQCELQRREKHVRRTKEHFTLGQGTASFVCATTFMSALKDHRIARTHLYICGHIIQI